MPIVPESRWHCKQNAVVIKDKSCIQLSEESGMPEKVNADERELETVFEAREESEAWAVQGLLQSAGLDVVVQSLEFPQDIMPGVGNVAVRVPAQQAADARQILASYENNPPEESDGPDSSAAKVPPPS
jgi:hypothetical protein